MRDQQTTPLHILLVEDNATHAHLIQRSLQRAGNGGVVLHHVRRLEEALLRLKQGDINAVLLDLSLPDSDIHETLPTVIAAHREVPIIVLTSLDDLEFATHAVGQGAQDFLVKSDLNGPLLYRAINYAIERQKTQERLESYAAELESSNEQLRGFAHTVAHEVKSPLTVVSVCLQRLQQIRPEELGSDLTECVADANAALRGLTAMVNDLLQFSRMGESDPQLDPVDMEAIFYHSYVCLRPAITDAHAIVTHDPLPVVRGNEIQLRQLLLNLIGNAIKYCDQDPPRIHVAAEEQGGNWIFHVRDNGIGIAPEDLSRIFEAFVRVSRKDTVPGSGIGLALCQRIVHNHGGHIWVDSQQGKGSTFHFTLPLTRKNGNTR